MGFTAISQKVEHVKRARQTRNHACHWPECGTQVAPALWGCHKHWYMLPHRLRLKMWIAYRIKQEETATPSRQYIKVAREVQNWIQNYLTRRQA